MRCLKKLESEISLSEDTGLIMTQEQLDKLEVDNNEAKAAIEVGEAFKRMMATDDYKLVIAKGYVLDYAKELGEAIATNTGAYDEAQLVSQLKGINGFIQYGFKIANNHMAGEQTLAANEAFVASQDEEE